MQDSEIAKANPLFIFIQKFIRQPIESISVGADNLMIKWREQVGEETKVYSKEIKCTPNEFKSLANTELKLTAIQFVLDNYPVGIQTDGKNSSKI